MLEHVQIIEEHGQAKFAVIDFEKYLSIKALLSEPEKLADYLDYLHLKVFPEAFWLTRTAKSFTFHKDSRKVILLNLKI